MSATLVCIDLGTTRLKVAAFTPEGELLQQVATRHKETPDGQNPTQWWRDAAAAIRSLRVDNAAGLSLSGRGGAGIFLDRDGNVLAGPWADDRHAAELRRLYAWRSGRFLPNYGAALVAKYLWLRDHHAGLARRCRYALYGKDYVLFRLTVTHTYHGKVGGVLGYRDAAIPAFRDAVARGVVVDVDHGRSSFSFRVCEAALGQGMPVHTISSDPHRGNVARYAVSLARTMTKLALLGVPFLEVVRAVTKRPVEAAGLDRLGFGRIAAGHPAYLTVFDLVDGAFEVEDATGESRTASRWFETRGVVVRDTYHERTRPL